MKQTKFFLILLMLFIAKLYAQPPARVIAECTVNYVVVGDSTLNASTRDVLSKTFKNLYIKGNSCRTDLITPFFKQSAIYEKNNGTVTFLKETGANKFITRYSKEQWVKLNNQYDSVEMIKTADSKSILGYNCKKIIFQYQNGIVYEVYAAAALVTSVKEYEYQFRDVNGLVLEYTVKDKDGSKLIYRATKINVNPVSATLFNIPQSGYRLLEP